MGDGMAAFVHDCEGDNVGDKCVGDSVGDKYVGHIDSVGYISVTVLPVVDLSVLLYSATPSLSAHPTPHPLPTSQIPHPAHIIPAPPPTAAHSSTFPSTPPLTGVGPTAGPSQWQRRWRLQRTPGRFDEASGWLR